MEDVALSRTFGDDAGRWFQEQLEAQGRRPFHGGEELEAFEGDGRVSAVVTKSGLSIECDAVVVGAGVRPDAMLAAAGRDRGRRRRSSATRSCGPRSPGIYAAGDCCSYDSVVHGRRIRVEHWDVAMQQGIHAAGNMLGDDARLRRRPLLLQRPRRLGQPRVRRPGPGLGRGGLARRPRGRRVLGLVPEGRPRRRRPQRRPLRRPGRSAADAGRRRRRLRRPRSHRRSRQRPLRDRLSRTRGYPAISALRPGVMAAHLALEEAVGVRVPGPQLLNPCKDV